jgi:prevent-host-death family protein
MALLKQGVEMQHMSARDAKNSFGKLIDIARAEPVAVEKHGRAVVVVISVESYRLLSSGSLKQTSAKATIEDGDQSMTTARQASARKGFKQARSGK